MYQTFDLPYTNMCTDIDVTNFMNYIRDNNYKFFPTMIYFLTKTANVLKEFRCRIENGVPVIWDNVRAGYTLMQDTQKFAATNTDFIDNLDTFYKNCSNDIECAKKGQHIVNKPLDNDAVIHITAIPWIKLSNFTFARHRKDSAVPYIGLGQRFQEGHLIKIPVILDTYHGFIDGYCIAYYYNVLQIMLSHPEDYNTQLESYEQLLEISRPSTKNSSN